MGDTSFLTHVQANAERNKVFFGSMNAQGVYTPNDTPLYVEIRTTTGRDDVQVYVRAIQILKSGESVPIEMLVPITQLDGSINLITKVLCEGFLQSVTVSAFLDNTTPPSGENLSIYRGEMYCQVYLKKGNVAQSFSPIFETLAAGYIETGKPLAYPESGVKSSIDGKGYIFQLESYGAAASTIPVATTNADILAQLGSGTLELFRYDVPINVRIKPKSLRLEYVNSGMNAPVSCMIFYLGGNGNAGTTDPVLQNSFWEQISAAFIDGVNVPCELIWSENLPSTSLGLINALTANLVDSISTGIVDVYSNPIPLDIHLRNTQSIVVAIDKGNLTDTITRVGFEFEQWIEPTT